MALGPVELVEEKTIGPEAEAVEGPSEIGGGDAMSRAYIHGK